MPHRAQEVDAALASVVGHPRALGVAVTHGAVVAAGEHRDPLGLRAVGVLAAEETGLAAGISKDRMLDLRAMRAEPLHQASTGLLG